MDHKKICKEKENSSSLRENKLLYQSSYFAHEKKKKKHLNLLLNVILH